MHRDARRAQLLRAARIRSAGSCRHRRGSAPGCACRAPAAATWPLRAGPASGAPAPRIQLLQRLHEARRVERLGPAHHLHVGAVAAAMAEGGEARPAFAAPTLPSARRTASRATTSLLPRAPSILPHMEPEPSKTMTTDAGSAGPRSRRPEGGEQRGECQRPTARRDPELHMANAAPSCLEPSRAPLYSRTSWFSEGFGSAAVRP